MSHSLTRSNLLAKLFNGFADLSRLRILETLTEGGKSVGKIVEETGLTQSNVSSHLRCLRECSLVTSKRDGQYIHYELKSPEKIVSFLRLASELLDETYNNIAACINYEVEA